MVKTLRYSVSDSIDCMSLPCAVLVKPETASFGVRVEKTDEGILQGENFLGRGALKLPGLEVLRLHLIVAVCQGGEV